MPSGNDPLHPPRPREARYRFFDGLHLPLGKSRRLVHSPLTDQTRVLANATAQLLLGCRTSATLEEHASAFRAQFDLGPEHAQAVHAQLAELAASGLLVTEQSLLERCLKGAVASIAPPPISSLGILAGDRPSDVRNSLHRLARGSRALGRAMRFVVADGSGDAASNRRNVAALTAVRNEFHCEIRYIGAEEKSRFAALLSERAHVAPDILRFALLNDDGFPVATGGDRNALLFATLGELTLQVADGIECALAPSPGQSQGLTLTSMHDPTQIGFDGSEHADRAGAATGQDPFSLHERLLGKSLAMCLQEYGTDNVDTDGMLLSFLRRVRGNEGRILVTSPGMAGDLGSGSEFSLLRLQGVARERLVRSASDYRRNMESQRGVRAVGNVTIGDGAFCSGLMAGLDNREPLPPFIPVQTNDCGFFAKAIRATGKGLFGHLPWTVRRRPPPRRHPDERAAGVRSDEIMEALVSFFDKTGGTGPDRTLADLGSLFVELGTMAVGDFNELLQQILWRRAVQRINALEELLAKHHHEPDFWAEGVATHLAALRQALPREDYLVPSDLRTRFGKEAARALIQRLVLRTGGLMATWLHLRKTALELRSREQPIGRSL